jgi:hypothetical protein
MNNMNDKMMPDTRKGDHRIAWIGSFKDTYDAWVDNLRATIASMETQASVPFNASVSKLFDTSIPGAGLIKDALDYYTDSWQRSFLYLNTMRKRGSIYLRHLQEGQPTVLIFKYEKILSGLTLNRPVNYDLVRIIPDEEYAIDPDKRPIVVVDPRAGHGPGIGGAKRESEIGMAMKNGHPAYFILFYPDPVPGQTLADVKNAELTFIEEVARRHPNSRKPSVIGNCQAGWAVAMMSAHMPGGTGPLVFNGAPLSYWSGVEGKDTMRYLGGLAGGAWIASFLSDLGAGSFDGANLVLNFELLNPANTIWTKQYNVYSKIDTEERRYLDFERWWNGYCLMTAEEIQYIVENLFIGNKLEQGSLEIEGKVLNLKDLVDPVVVFASSGDNITPPRQALNWIIKVWGSIEEIKRRRQAIIYILHKDIGHLGIFVSSKIATKEHNEIISSFDMIEYLPSGLYEMIIEDGDEAHAGFDVHFEERTFDDILALDAGPDEDKTTQQDERAFEIVRQISEKNNLFYKTYISPWIRLFTTDQSAEAIRQLHPLRMSRYAFSDLNPFFFPIKLFAPTVVRNRRQCSGDNPYMTMEKCVSENMITLLDYARDMRDLTYEYIFKSLYESDLLNILFPEEASAPTPEEEQRKKEDEEIIDMRNRLDDAYWINAMEEGGFVEGLIRMLLAIVSANHTFDRKSFLLMQQLVRVHPRLKDVAIPEFRVITKRQSRILQTDTAMAIQTLPILLPAPKDRKDAVEIAQTIFGHCELTEEAKAMLRKLRDIERRAQSESVHVKDGESHTLNTVTQTDLLASSDLRKKERES